MDDSTREPVGGIAVIETVDATVARLWGEIDEALREQASTALGRAIERELPVIIDTSQVVFIDSTGIAFLIQFCRIGREEGLRVTLLDPPQVVADVLEMLGLAHMFDHDWSDRTPLEPDVPQQQGRATARDDEVGGEPPLVRT